ncbi:INO80 complex subunit C [Lampris incognitus]|uniref:INO80 complex subunit C n=1 Tax=Lampris incognitus TaxID=2546036 RepID=UPI0024B4FECA|nr:INO80 complex subunit C [Lampris incognitus]
MATQIPTNVSSVKAGCVTAAGRTQLAAASSAALRLKKRPGSPATSCLSQQTSGNSSKKKKGQFPANTTQTQVVAVEAVAEMKPVGTADNAPAMPDTTSKPPPFKDPSFMHSGIGGAAAGKKNRTWKNLKQILALERTLPWKVDDPNYYNIDAPPSLKPAKKYSDISGLPANYTDPKTKLRFASSQEFSYIRFLSSDVVTGYLALRKATCIVP